MKEKLKPCNVWVIVDNRDGDVMAVRLYEDSIRGIGCGRYERVEEARLVPASRRAKPARAGRRTK